MPLVSVIVPAFESRDFIVDALHSILRQRKAPHFEIIVSPDDGQDYGLLRGMAGTDQLRVLPANGHHGVAAARNRAMDAAAGQYLALCDADDRWPENYLTELLPLAERYGAACAATWHVDQTGKLYRPCPPLGSRLLPETCARGLMPIRPLWKRSLDVRFQNVFAEDVLHVLHLMMLTGGGLPVATRTCYEWRERPGSITNAGLMGEQQIVAAYGLLIERLRSAPASLGLGNIDAVAHQEIVQAFLFWQHVNHAYLATGCTQSFRRFVGGREQELWQDFLAASE